MSLPRAFLITSCTVFLAALSASGLLAQQPRQDAEIAPTPGVTRIETPGERVTARNRTPQPKRTRTPQRSDAPAASTALGARIDGSGSGGTATPPGTGRVGVGGIPGWHQTREARDPRGAATWILFSVLVILLGGVTIRMVRGFDERELFERLDPDDMETQIPG